MGWKALGTLATVLLILAESAARGEPIAALPANLTLTVRTYDNFGVSAGNLMTAQRLTAEAFRQAGIVITWVKCSRASDMSPMGKSPRCAEPPDGADVIVQIVSGPRDPTSYPNALGFSVVSKEGREAPRLATVFADRVLSFAHSAATNAGAVLGLAMAHEIGHVLLNTNTHADNGLMRAVWFRSGLRRAARREARFHRTEAENLREGLRSRIQSAMSLSLQSEAHPSSTASLDLGAEAPND